MLLVAASLDPPPGLEAFLREVGNGESGFGGTEYATGTLSLHDYLQMQVDYAAGQNMADGHPQPRSGRSTVKARSSVCCDCGIGSTMHS